MTRFHGFAQFLTARDCKIALVQETNTPAAPSLPEDQPFVFDGHEQTLGMDAAFLVHQDQSATCIPIPNTTQHADICCSNLWIPGLVQACEQRSADRTCLASLQTLLQTFGLEICNPSQQPTHSRGAALDLVIASPGLVGSVHVHNRSCYCTDAELCCPLLSSDHYAVEINLMKRLIQAAHALNADAPVKHVRNWGDLFQAQEEKLKEWSRMIQSHLADPEPLANAPRRPVLDILYGDLLDILWHADPSLCRHPCVHSQTQPSWWNDECFEALLARNAAWRQRNRAPEMDSTFRSARNHFHRVVRSAKAKHWSNWLLKTLMPGTSVAFGAVCSASVQPVIPNATCMEVTARNLHLQNSKPHCSIVTWTKHPVVTKSHTELCVSTSHGGRMPF